MRTVYVDVFLFVNLFESFLLLLGVKLTLRLRCKYYRLALGGLVSAFLSLSVFLPITNFFFNMLTIIISSAAATLISFGYNSRRLFIKTLSTLIILTLLFSGSMIFLYLAFKPNGMTIINNRPYFDISPALLIILTVIIYFILTLYKKLFKNHTSSGLLHSVKFLYENNTCEFKAKADSGCNLKEPFSSSSVIIAEKKTIDFTVDTTKCRIIPFESLGGNGIIYGFKADEVYIDGRKCSQEVYIGLCEGVLNSDTAGLIPTELLGG